MAFNKNKALESALKFLNQGKVAQAIGEYQQILRQDSKDQATLMTVGDLFARQGDMTQAIEYFERLAQVYLNDGFNSKAIAIYKKIAKLAPTELAPLERLADLYVQQGVLSEARPLFLQIAEAHLKANHAPKAVDVLHRLLDVEPENPRVQMRLAELYNMMGQKKEAAQTYLSYSQRLFERGEGDEALKLVERALGVDSVSGPALLLKAKILSLLQKNDQAIGILESHPEAATGGEVTRLLVEFELKAGRTQKAADRARRQLASNSAHSGLLQHVADFLISNDQPDQALPLLRELRHPMVETGQQDEFLKMLTDLSEKLPDNIEALEMLADFSRHTSDPFHLNAALSRLVDLYSASGDYSRAEPLMEEMVERNKGDERVVARFNQLRKRSGASTESPEETSQPEPPEEAIAREEAPAAQASAEALLTESAPSAPVQIAEESYDEETQRYIAQALTDVDLFSSYGLTQKAAHLLENVLQRAPRHTPTLERLLDLYLGAGNDSRTAELATELEQIHRERQDTVNADRFAELRRRFQGVPSLSSDKPATLPVARIPVAASETEVETVELLEPEEAVSVEEFALDAATVNQAHSEFEIQSAAAESHSAEEAARADVAPAEASVAPAEPQLVGAGEEVDLSDEWEAMVQEVADPAPAVAQEAPAAPEAARAVEETVEIEATPAEEPIEILEEVAEAEAEPEPAGNAEFELELTPDPGVTQGVGAATTEDFLNELAAEIEGMESPMPDPPAPAVEAHASPDTFAVAPEVTSESLNELSEVFQEFRNELGELGEEDEDLETHYNLGIAYREMGLLDEAIGEFQKVAKAVQKGKPFRYAMNCSTMLALSFMDKGEPKIASLWYQRALDTPGLDAEAILALRYDLGVALDMSGDEATALDIFRQVYAINIDFRDVADRIAILQKH